MNNHKATIGILVFPETTGAVVYGMYDMFLSAGRDWGVITDGAPGAELIQTLLIARTPEPVTISNGVRVVPHTSMAQCPALDVICIPEAAAPGRPVSGSLS